MKYPANTDKKKLVFERKNKSKNKSKKQNSTFLSAVWSNDRAALFFSTILSLFRPFFSLLMGKITELTGFVLLRFNLKILNFKLNGGLYLIYIYFNDKNGTIYSADKQRCFSVVFGDDVYAFLRSEKNKEKRFYRTQTEETGGDMVLIEVPPEIVRAVRKEEKRKQYVSDCMKNKEFTILHLGDMDSDDGITGEELIASLDESVDTLAIRNIDVSTLRKALKTLNEKEYEVIASLHYASPPLTEAQLADHLGVHQSTISRRKNAAYRKIRKFFEKN